MVLLYVLVGRNVELRTLVEAHAQITDVSLYECEI